MEPIDTEEHRPAPMSKASQRKMIAIVVAVGLALVALVALNMN